MHRSIGAAVLVAVLAASAPASAAEPTAPTAAVLESWQTKIAQVPQPSKGCFTSSYPRLSWQLTDCGPRQGPAPTPTVPRPSQPGPRPWPLEVGNLSGDLTAVAPSGHISSATGSFDSVTGVTSETSPPPGGGAGVANNYTLQLNTDYFETPACDASPNPDCRGWEQFVYWNKGNEPATMFIQYWLYKYNTACPSDVLWTPYQPPNSTDMHCFRNAYDQMYNLPNQPITNLGSLKVVGNATPSGDSMTFFVGPNANTITGDNTLSASGAWTIAEFNVLGGAGGKHATFNDGATIKTRTLINYGGDEAPGCATKSFTGETSNLGFGTPAPAPTPPGPSIQFIEDTAHDMPPDCAFAAAIGDTHQHTVAGLLYDFQAAGDFVEAQVGADFEVQTRKVSGAPTWPDASVNQSVAARLGPTKVALCEGKKLFIDGQPVTVDDGTSVWVPPGVDVGRLGNTYVFIDQDGNSVRVTVKSGYLDVAVGLGAYPVPVRGLLGNPDGDVKRLEASDGTQFSVPVSFNDLYQRYGDSWRLDPAQSLLSVCGTKAEQGNPGKPFFAGDLDPALRERARAVCRGAQISPVWLDACTLDVAVLGSQAAAAYVGAKIPVLTNP